MPHEVVLDDALFARLQKHAVPLVDTPQSVIARALEALEEGDENVAVAAGVAGVRSFNPAAAPNLSHTTPRKAVVAGRSLSKADTYWNPILFAVILEAARRGIGTEDLLTLITVNAVAGRKEENGYRFLEPAGLSIQGQDANSAWKQTYRIASSLGIAVEVVFVWQDSSKAAMPNVTGSFFVEGDRR